MAALARGARAADVLESDQSLAERVAASGDPLLADPARTARVLRTIAESFRNFSVVARRESELRAELGRLPEVVVTVPELDADVHDLAGLVTLGEHLLREG